jgi:AcrR family transcriptional regulator
MRLYTDLFPRASWGRKLADVPPVTKPTPRQRLLDAAAELFYARGIGAVGVDLISKAAGVSKRTLYAEFGSKDQLIAQSLDARGTGIVGMYLPPAGSDASPREQILAVFGRLDAWAASEFFRGCAFVNAATELADPGHPARDVARHYKQRIRDFFADQAARGGAADPHALAGQLAVVFDGTIVQAVVGTPVPFGTVRGAVLALLDAHEVR